MDRLKTVRKNGKSKIHEPKANHIAHFEAMFDAKICPAASPELAMADRCFSAKAPQLRSSGPFSLQPEQLQSDYVSSYTACYYLHAKRLHSFHFDIYISYGLST